MQMSSSGGWQCPNCPRTILLANEHRSFFSTSDDWDRLTVLNRWASYSAYWLMSFLPFPWSESWPFQLSTLSTNEISDFSQPWALFLFLGLRVGPLTASDHTAFNFSRLMRFLISPNQWALFLFLGLRVGRLTASDHTAFNFSRPMSFLISPNQCVFFLFLGLRVWPAGSSRRYSFQPSRPLSFLISPNQWAFFLFLGLRVGRLTASDGTAFISLDQWAFWSLPTNEICFFS
jgi:hypothetical protein